MDNQIKIWNNFAPEKLCDRTIHEFERIISDSNLSSYLKHNNTQFGNGPLGRDDIGIFLENPVFDCVEIVEEYLNILQTCITEYVEYYPALKHFRLTNYRNIKIQKTNPLGGYHVWHCERDGSQGNSQRELAWMIYLNDMPINEAETEFLYQAVKVKPSKGTVVIWPAGFSHIHRGLTVYSKPKYIATGWYHSFWS